MIWAILVLGFISYSIWIFFISSWWVLLGLVVFQIVLMIVCWVNVLHAVRSLLLLSPVIFLTGLFNYFFTDLETAAMVATRLAIMCNMTYIFASTVPIMKFVTGMKILFTPIRIFGVNPRDIAVTIAVAVTFIPISLSEFKRIRDGIRARSGKPRFGLISKIFVYKILYRASCVGATLEAKGYR